MTMETRITDEIAAAIGHYVYALRDPRDREVFYVGKGVGGRLNAHSHEAGKDRESQRAKLGRINDIEGAGLAVDLLFLRTGLPDDLVAFIVEQAVIDAFYADGHPLTNLVRGHHASSQGLATISEVINRHGADPCPPINAPLIMVKIQANWRPDSNDADIYEYTRGHWPAASWVRDRVEFCLGVAHGVVRGAYRIDSWFPSEMPWDAGKNRWGFHGTVASELQDVVGTHVRAVFNGRSSYRRFVDRYAGS